MSEKDQAWIVLHIWCAACAVYFKTEWLIVGLLVLSFAASLMLTIEYIIRGIKNGNKEG